MTDLYSTHIKYLDNNVFKVIICFTCFKFLYIKDNLVENSVILQISPIWQDKHVPDIIYAYYYESQFLFNRTTIQFSLTKGGLYIILFSEICLCLLHSHQKHLCRQQIYMFNATFSNILVISLMSVLMVEETGENHRPVTSH